jgi:hypothetical protein
MTIAYFIKFKLKMKFTKQAIVILALLATVMGAQQQDSQL